MKTLKPHHFLALFVLILLVCSNFPAFSQSRTDGLKQRLQENEQKVFNGFEVDPEAQQRMEMLIDKAVMTYDKQRNSQIYRQIMGNFDTLTDEIRKNATPMRASVIRHGMIGLAGSYRPKLQITIQSIEKALKKLCPLFPFC